MATNSRVALVTGGMGGLGEAICLKLAALGYTVVTTHSPGNTKAPEWLAAMKKQGYNFHAYACDVADWGSAAECVKKVSAEIGPIDVLVTLLHEMGRRNAKKGLASLCIGGGMGVALAVER